MALPFRTAKEAVALGNNTKYGLGSSVWTENISLAMEVSALYNYLDKLTWQQMIS